MDIKIKEQVDKFRKEGLSYAKIADILSCKTYKINCSTIRNYSISRVPKINLTVRDQYKTLTNNRKKISHYAKSAFSLEDLYDSTKDIDGCYDINFAAFSLWVCSSGGIKSIKQDTPHKKAGCTPVFIGKLKLDTLNNNKKLILNNLASSYQKICDMIQDKTDIIILPCTLCEWFRLNNIKKIKSTSNDKYRTVTKKLIDAELDIAFSENK